MITIGMAMLLQVATTAPAASDYGFQKIADGNFDAAEVSLQAASIAEPDEPLVLINLAQVYRRTGRVDQARAMYRRVLETPNADLVLGDYRTAWSHDLARRGIATLTQVASR